MLVIFRLLSVVLSLLDSKINYGVQYLPSQKPLYHNNHMNHHMNQMKVGFYRESNVFTPWSQWNTKPHSLKDNIAQDTNSFNQTFFLNNLVIHPLCRISLSTMLSLMRVYLKVAFTQSLSGNESICIELDECSSHRTHVLCASSISLPAAILREWTLDPKFRFSSVVGRTICVQCEFVSTTN